MHKSIVFMMREEDNCVINSNNLVKSLLYVLESTIWSSNLLWGPKNHIVFKLFTWKWFVIYNLHLLKARNNGWWISSSRFWVLKADDLASTYAPLLMKLVGFCRFCTLLILHQGQVKNDLRWPKFKNPQNWAGNSVVLKLKVFFSYWVNVDKVKDRQLDIEPGVNYLNSSIGI